MRNRGERRRKKALIKKRLVEKMIDRYNRVWAGWRSNGTFVPYIERISELPKSGYYTIRDTFRNEGQHRERVFRCGETGCDWCIANRCRKYKRAYLAREADWQNWLAGDYDE